MNATKSVSIIFNQLLGLLNNLDNYTYSKPINILDGNSIGQHIRHVIEYYTSILSKNEKGRICYDNRKRDPQVEQEVDFAKFKLIGLLSRVEMLDVDEKVTIETRFTANSNEPVSIIHSTVGRELMYAFDHAIHHLAIVKIGAQSAFPIINIPEDLGIAPSTIKYRKDVHSLIYS